MTNYAHHTLHRRIEELRARSSAADDSIRQANDDIAMIKGRKAVCEAEIAQIEEILKGGAA